MKTAADSDNFSEGDEVIVGPFTIDGVTYYRKGIVQELGDGGATVKLDGGETDDFDYDSINYPTKLNWDVIRKAAVASAMTSFRNRNAAVTDRVNPENISRLWYENDAGERWVPDFDKDFPPEPPSGFNYQFFLDDALSENCVKIIQQEQVDQCGHPREYCRRDQGLIDGVEGEICDKCGGERNRNTGESWGAWEACGSRPIMTMNMGWSKDLVLAMAERGVDIGSAILMAATACERCMNALAYEFGLDWGYPECSPEWQKTNTECDYCRGVCCSSRTAGAKDVLERIWDIAKYKKMARKVSSVWE